MVKTKNAWGPFPLTTGKVARNVPFAKGRGAYEAMGAARADRDLRGSGARRPDRGCARGRGGVRARLRCGRPEERDGALRRRRDRGVAGPGRRGEGEGGHREDGGGPVQ